MNPTNTPYPLSTPDAISFLPAGIMFLFVLLAFAIMIAVTLIPFWMIFKKAGFHPALSLLTLVPVANIVMLYFLAFAQWPALKGTPVQGTPYR